MPIPPLSFALLLSLIVSGVAGCTSQTGPDSNVGVFKTPEEAGAYRRQKLYSDWQELAARIANAERPDVRTIKDGGFALLASADGVQRRIDLSPLNEQLISAQGNEREPIRAHLSRELSALDRDRLIALGFERVKPLLWPHLANSRQIAQIGIPGRRESPIGQQVVIDLYNVPVVRWPGAAGARTAIDQGVLKEWKVSEEQVVAAAIENLKRSFEQSKDVFQTIDLPGMGRYGSLRTGADASVVLLPEFLAEVRRQWNTQDDLIILMPSRTSVTFTESRNTRLLDRMIPEWSRLYEKVSEPLIPTLVLASDKGLSLSNYRPPVQPGSAPPPAPAPPGLPKSPTSPKAQ